MALQINSKQAFIKDFNGKEVKLAQNPASTGTSGETKLYHIAGGTAGLYLRDDEVIEVK